jgi:hypothetical protein
VEEREALFWALHLGVLSPVLLSKYYSFRFSLSCFLSLSWFLYIFSWETKNGTLIYNILILLNS